MKIALSIKQVAELALCVMLLSRFAYSSTMKMEAKYSSELSDYFQRTTKYCISEDGIL
jgi:hypothetical protein